MTRNGSCIYNSSSEKFEPDVDTYLRSLGLPAGTVSKIIDGKKGRFWFLYDNGDIYLYTGKGNKAQLIYNDPVPGKQDKTVSLREIEGTGYGSFFKAALYSFLILNIKKYFKPFLLYLVLKVEIFNTICMLMQTVIYGYGIT
ncbi:hypothetical protein LWM68_19500 [Niabella sp. W65]|nr:hypothetical protein [Niabella sp. W65]MCH7364753.1 hypothetical protein [Niabella sp. W65]